MKALIVGLGSMGKRRIRLLRGIDKNAEIIGVDTNPERRAQVEEMGCKTYRTIEEAAAEKPEAAFVCTSPVAHYPIIKDLLSYKINTFTELNLVSDGYEELMSAAKENNTVLFLSSTMLYRGEINYIQNRVKNFDKPVSYIYHIGQYLPDWHPWESYKNFFVSNKRTNGCRELFGIELPWIIETFGKIKEIYSTADKMTDLEIDFPDRFFVTITHENGTKGILAIDVVSPKAVRNLEVFGEGMHLFWEGNPKTLYDFNVETKEKEFINTYESFEHDSRYSDNIVENAYVDEMQNFIGVIKGLEQPKYSYEKDLYTIKIMDEIEGIK
ncbi:MAG: Gfo/Idh/MocA family oxidoreductase [Oscillospiraceae bacterium]|nr:Gfo/Idh/MocA family oxidoreductase [Oscillospiraceae bacterium]MDY4586612.1 Gfo/Idh/MocA family oxidoreductase [Oscillospiraceae bacterium]